MQWLFVGRWEMPHPYDYPSSGILWQRLSDETRSRTEAAHKVASGESKAEKRCKGSVRSREVAAEGQEKGKAAANRFRGARRQLLLPPDDNYFCRRRVCEGVRVAT